MNANFGEVETTGNVIVTMSKEEFFSKFYPEKSSLQTKETQPSKSTNTSNNIYSIQQYTNLHSTLENITNLLAKLGMPRHIKGFTFVRRAIELSITDKKYYGRITKELYPTLAKEFATTPSRVERAIRHAIEVAWSRSDPETQEKVFGYTLSSIKAKPTNAEFIAMISDTINLGTGAAS